MTSTATPNRRRTEGPGAAHPGTWPTEIRALMAVTFLARSAGFCYPFLPYHLDQLQLTPEHVGAGLAVFGAGWLVGSMLWGWLADRIGRRATLLTAMTLAALTLVLLAQAHTLNTVMAASFVTGAVYDAPRPILSAAIAERYGDDRSRAAVNAARNFVVNGAAALAGAVGGLLADFLGIPALLWANAAACTVCAVLTWTVVSTHDSAAPAPGHRGRALRDRRLWLLLITSLATLTACGALFSSLPLLMARSGLSAADYGWAQTANAVAVLALSPSLNRRLSKRAGRGRPMTGMLAVSALILGASMGSAAFASDIVGFALAAALAVPGEIVAFNAAGDILARISPAGAHGLYAGIWGTTIAGAVVLSPILASWSLAYGGTTLTAVTTLTVGVLGAVLCWPLTRITRGPVPALAP